MKSLSPAFASAFAVALLISCNSPMKNEAVLYTSNSFTLYKDSVVQGSNKAVIISPSHIRSNYKSPASSTFPKLIKFKISINEKDNEMPPGSDHWVIIGDEHESPMVVFGEEPPPVPDAPSTYLPANYEYTFRVDMSPVIRQFEEKGYFESYDGSRVSQAEFKGFYIAGSSLPLSWDFVGLEEKGLKLHPTGKGHIYSITVKLNPFNEADIEEKEWRLHTDVSNRPSYTSEQPIVDAMFNLSLEEAIKNIEPDSTFRTGAKWGGVWTRDISYSILLAFAFHEPDIAKISLRKKVSRGRIIQDTGSGGAWPVSSDRTTWVLAAWEIFKVTGDTNWLNEVYPIIKNTLEDDFKNLYDPLTGMYRGESSFLDWREQTYPKWMNNTDIAVSQNLGTNAVHYQAHRILAEMARIKGDPYDAYKNRAEGIRKGINQWLWMDDKGYYAQYLYGRTHMTVSPRFEALGEALAVIFNIAGPEKADAILSRSPVTAYGVTCIYPQIPGIPPYHNNAIWPFVQAYWNLAAAQAENETVLHHGLASIYRAGAFFLSNYENMVGQTGDFLGTEINSDRMLWSMAGNLAMVYRVLIGMSFGTDGLHLQPSVPEPYKGIKTLRNFKYRAALLDITVRGFGNRIAGISMDGKPMQNNIIPADLTGKHHVEIELDNKSFGGRGMNRAENQFSLSTPKVGKTTTGITWDAIPGAKEYRIYKNGAMLTKTASTTFDVPDEVFAEYSVSAADERGYESFTSEPMMFAEKAEIIEFEHMRPASGLPYTNFTGNGFVELSLTGNRVIAFVLDMEKEGEYLLDIRYSNGNGPWNTDNKCAIRSLSINGRYAGPLIFPQRGQDEWSDWGYSNVQRVKLAKGNNQFLITFEDWNHNMNGEVNSAMLDHLRVIWTGE